MAHSWLPAGCVAFHAHDRVLETISALRPLLDKLHAVNAPLTGQMREAAESMALNLEEGTWKTGRDRSNRYRISGGSAAEVRSALHVAVAWGQLTEEETRAALELLDQVLAIVWRLLNPVRSDKPSSGN